MRWHHLAATAVVALLLIGGSSVYGQEKEKGKGKGRRGGGFNPINFFAQQLNLSDEQKDKTKQLQEEYAPKVEKLTKELRELGQQQMEAFEQLLTDDQRQQLKELREKFKNFKGKGKGKGRGKPPAGD
jgi:hypothetical protein